MPSALIACSSWILDVALQQIRQVAVARDALVDGGTQPDKGAAGRTSPLVVRGRPQFGGEPWIAGDVTRIEQRERDAYVVDSDRQRLRNRTHGVVERDARVPDGIPDPVGDRGHRRPAMQQ